MTDPEKAPETRATPATEIEAPVALLVFEDGSEVLAVFDDQQALDKLCKSAKKKDVPTQGGHR